LVTYKMGLMTIKQEQQICVVNAMFERNILK